MQGVLSPGALIVGDLPRELWGWNVMDWGSRRLRPEAGLAELNNLIKLK